MPAMRLELCVSLAKLSREYADAAAAYLEAVRAGGSDEHELERLLNAHGALGYFYENNGEEPPPGYHKEDNPWKV